MKKDLINFWRSHGFSERLLDAFMKVKREEFVPKELREAAYEDIPLPLMRGKTISQPSTVIVMTAALDLTPGDKVFEVGTGSGYQSAIISEIVGKDGEVVTTEVIPELVQFAKNNLKGRENIKIFEEDGSRGMESEAPFDKIILTAAAKEFPKPLVAQLKEGGVIVGPVGTKDNQEMIRGVKVDDGLDVEFLGQFLFTPMYGKYGFEY